MLICADVKCYHCGFVSGEVCGDSDKAFGTAAFKPNATISGAAIAGKTNKRCLRCGGPIYLEDVRPMPGVRTYILGPSSDRNNV